MGSVPDQEIYVFSAARRKHWSDSAIPLMTPVRRPSGRVTSKSIEI